MTKADGKHKRVSHKHDYAADRIRLLMTLRTRGISDTRVLGAIEKVPREKFVTPAFHDKAYEDTALPIAQHQTISQPTVVAAMTEALDIGERMTVLEIGTGSGYQTAILSKLARRVYTIERHRDLLKQAEKLFAELHLRNITTQCGDGSKGWKSAAPFDRIIVTAAAEKLPQALVDQLAVGGKMVIPVGPQEDHQNLLLVERTPERLTTRPLMDVRFVPLVEETKE